MEKREKLNWEEMWPRLLGFYPFMAEDGGNYTTLLFSEGKQLTDKRKTNTVLNNLARTFSLDLALVKAKGRKVLGYRREVPLVFLSELVLLPVRIRRAPMKDAGSLGYVVLSQLVEWEKASEEPWRTKIVFYDHTYLNILTTLKTFRNKVAQAELVLGEYHRRHHSHLRPGYPVSYGWPSKQTAVFFRERGRTRY